MSGLQDFQLYAAGFNFLSMLGNVWWSFKLNSIKGSGELAQYWKNEYEKKENENIELKRALDKIEKRLTVYQRYHGHKTLAYNEKRVYT